MKILLTEKEIEELQSVGIEILTEKEYSDDEAMEIMDRIRDVEIYYSQNADKNRKDKARAIRYGDIADKLQVIIDEA